jgi:cellulose synthase (UDP-forming)
VATRLPGRVVSDLVISGADRWVYRALVVAWVLANLVFWVWWLQPEHVATPWFFALVTVTFAYDAAFLPTMFLYFVGRMRSPRPLAAPSGLRVALITLCVPKEESLDVIARQMAALTAVTYPHDSWVLDEGNSPEVRAEAERLGVRYFTRSGVDRYNRPMPPFKAKTKAGNVNAWLDAHGGEYDYFVQLDIDHRPAPEYLDHVLGYFRDPDVAWVQAPSVYGEWNGWVARGAAEQELVLQGPLQRGFFGASETPFIIGSHCTYRMSAVQEIGGFQPTRAEDHLDTLFLASRGYRGVFVPKILAVGAGPDTFETYLRQQFAWALSMIEVLLTFTPRLLRSLRPRQAAQFLFAQTWYPLWSTSMLVLFAVPVIALLTGRQPANVSLLGFLMMSAPITGTAIVAWLWTRRWHLPLGLALSWRGIVLHVARWPIVIWALLNVLLRIKHPYMITPKGGTGGIPTFSLRSQLLYVGAIWGTLGVIWWYGGGGRPAVAGQLDGFMLLALWASLFMLAVFATCLLTDVAGLVQQGVRLLRLLSLRWAPLSVLLATTFAFTLTLTVNGQHIAEAATWRGTPETSGARAQRILRASADRTATAVAVAPPTLSVAPPQEHDAATSSSVAEESATPLPTATPTQTIIASTTAEAVSPGRTSSLPMDLPSDRLAIGAYDPWQVLDASSLDIEHWYVRQDEPELLGGALVRTRDRATLLVTVEPFSTGAGSTSVLDDVASGRRDEELRQLARVARDAAPQVVLVRWGHEMELSSLYPWSGQDPELYRQAFRHVVTVFREEGSTNVRWVWSPAGVAGAEAYYPGDDVVDYVGLTVLGDAGWDRGFGLPPQSFAEVLRPRYALIERFQKPVIVTEAGVSGTRDRQARWLRDATRALDEMPLVRAIVYFNDVNTPNTIVPTRPDWKVDRRTFGELLPRQP